ncbi:MAG: hypothetical protein BWX66_00552 [Deltaproteobacteria bacterium ADurb.Bin058]|nr:MAG: hypothetical protein BWX66_00552 [Deltaproteobacteria bacterium ADurb.Bin058]
MRLSFVVTSVVATMFLFACGGKITEFKPTEQEKAHAAALTTDTLELKELKVNLQGEGALGALNSIQESALYLTSQQQQRNVSPNNVLGLLSGGMELRSFGDCASVSDSRVTYNNCGDENSSINGYFEVDGDVVKMDITIRSKGYDDIDLVYRYEGAVIVSDTLLDGALNISLSGATFSYTLDVRYSQIVIASDCAVGGSLRLEVNTKVSGTSISTGATSATVIVDFGPNCGAMTMKGGK